MHNQIKTERIDFLDGFRGIACLLVMFHHSFKSLLKLILEKLHLLELYYYTSSFSQSGVEIFFVLSGFVLTTKFFNNPDSSFNIFTYFKRRFLRIYPPYLIAWVIACAVIYVNTFYPTWYSRILVKFNWSTAFSFLYMFRLNVDYYNLAWWSLQIELIFYFLVPIIFCYRYTILKGKSYKYLILILFGLLAMTAQFGSESYFPQYYSMEQLMLTTFMFTNYALCFFMGVTVAANYWKPTDVKVLIPIGLVFIFISKFTYCSLANTGYALVYGGLMVYLFNYNSLIINFLNNKYLIWFGERSYSFFLTHFSIFYLSNYLVSYFVDDRSIVYGLFTRLIGWILSLFVGLLVFEFVEKKFAHNLNTKSNILPS